MRLNIVALTLGLLGSSSLEAQSCPLPPSGGTVWFEFQVATPAQFAGDTTLRPVPDQNDLRRRPFPPEFALAQFVVDTAGVPVVRSLRMLQKPDSLSLELVQASLEHWRFTPAKVAGCKVSQLVQTPLRWR